MGMDDSTSVPIGRREKQEFRITIRLALMLIALIALSLGAQRSYQDWRMRQTFSANVYAVADLVMKGDAVHFDPLISRIKSEVETSSWETNGGEGTIQPFFLSQSLIVKNHQLAQDKIARLLRTMRQE